MSQRVLSSSLFSIVTSLGLFMMPVIHVHATDISKNIKSKKIAIQGKNEKTRDTGKKLKDPGISKKPITKSAEKTSKSVRTKRVNKKVNPFASSNAQILVNSNRKKSNNNNSDEKIVNSFSSEMGLHKGYNPLTLNSGSALIMDMASGEVKYAKNHEVKLPIASITKLMTAIVTLDAKGDMDESLTITSEDVDSYKKSSSRLPIGTSLSRSDMLKLALMSSENRASHALSRYYKGGEKRFVAAMNEKAKSLGMRQTYFDDSTGLSEKNQSSALDLAKLVKAAHSYEFIKKWSTEKEKEVMVNNRMLRYQNSNPLVKNPSWDIVLQKTGYTREAGRCVVMEIIVNQKQYGIVLLDSMTPRSRIEDAKKLHRHLTSKVMSS